MVNAVLSFIQEQRAAGVVETLRTPASQCARAARANWQVVPARRIGSRGHHSRAPRRHHPRGYQTPRGT